MQFVKSPAVVGGELSATVGSRYSHTRVYLRVLLLLVVCMPMFAMAAPGDTTEGEALPASCPIPDAGAPSCGIESAPGSSRYESEVPHKVGNPIDVVSGNKYQYELDYQSPVSGLALARHYNSSLSEYDVGIGAGWRHSFQVVLTRISEERLDIVQSDGRLISFHKASSGSGEADLFLASQASDGYLQLGERSVWTLVDGRRLIFQGSYLVRMELGERGGVLTLHYQNGKLDTVTDQHGSSLSFNYVPGTPALPDYGSKQVVQPAGSIASVLLPGGDLIQYHYGKHGNLTGVRYPDEDSVGYVYADSDWPSHLTRRQSTVDGRLSEWRYDRQGLGVAWVEGGGINGLEIERNLPPSAETLEGPSPSGQQASTAQAAVTYADGRKTLYRWTPVDDGFGDEGAAAIISCDNCLPQAPSVLSREGADTRQGNYSGADTSAQDELVSSDGGSHSGMSSMDESVQSMLKDMALSAEQPEQGAGRSKYSGIYPHPQGDVPIEMTTDRLGAVKDLRIGQTTYADILEQYFSGQLQPCFAGSSPENPDTFSHDRIAALGNGASPCELDPAVMVEFEHTVKQFIDPDRRAVRSKSSGVDDKEATLPFWHDMYRYCGLPAGLTCEQLAEDLDMALLSRCAYGGESCEPAFRLVSPSEIGMADDRFDNQGFDAQLYQDPDEPDRYILVFRGTDGVGDDWTANLDQAKGEWSRQYDLALNLGRDVVDTLPNGQVEFSGHSLGGGLASLAALETHRPATVFNTAALQPGTADYYGLTTEYRNAEEYIRHLHTDYDPVTVLQERADELDILDFQTAPGVSTEIPNPDIPWMNEVNAQASSFGEGFAPLIWHSMNAVIHVMESLMEFNCAS